VDCCCPAIKKTMLSQNASVNEALRARPLSWFIVFLSIEEGAQCLVLRDFKKQIASWTRHKSPLSLLP